LLSLEEGQKEEKLCVQTLPHGQTIVFEDLKMVLIYYVLSCDFVWHT